MLSFHSGVDSEPVLALFKNIFEGMSKSEFINNSEVAKKFGIKNIKFNSKSLSPIYMSMKFECIYGHVKISHNKFSSMDIQLRTVPLEEMLTEHDRQLYSCHVSDERTEKDYTAITSLIKSMGTEDPHRFQLKCQWGYEDYDRVMMVSLEQFYTSHKELANLLINKIGRELGFITSNEADYLCKLFALVDEPIHNEHVSQFFAVNFDVLFNTLHHNGHTTDNKFYFKDMDNYLHIINSQDKSVRGIVSRTQNHLFLFAKNSETGVIKMWNTISINDPVKQELFHHVDKNNVFDGAKYIHELLFLKYGEEYYYPFEFEANQYRKTPATLLENFESSCYDAHLIYSSDTGFYPKQSRKFEACVSNFDWSHEIVTDYYQVDSSVINYSTIDYRSPTYVIRKLTNSVFPNRVSALTYLLTTMGHSYYWQEGGIHDGSGFIENLEQNEKELKVEKITEDVFMFGKACMIFHRPDDISTEWLDVIREYVNYYKEWVYSLPDKKSLDYLAAKERLDILVTI